MPEREKYHQIILEKGYETYIVRFAAEKDGEKSIETIISWAENPDLNFSWFDEGIMARAVFSIRRKSPGERAGKL